MSLYTVVSRGVYTLMVAVFILWLKSRMTLVTGLGVGGMTGRAAMYLKRRPFRPASRYLAIT